MSVTKILGTLKEILVMAKKKTAPKKKTATKKQDATTYRGYSLREESGRAVGHRSDGTPRHVTAASVSALKARIDAELARQERPSGLR